MGLLSLSSRVANVGLARLGATGCPGIQVQRLDRSAVASCIQTPVPSDPGQIAISLVSGGGWLAIGETTMRSTDDLALTASSLSRPATFPVLPTPFVCGHVSAYVPLLALDRDVFRHVAAYVPLLEPAVSIGPHEVYALCTPPT